MKFVCHFAFNPAVRDSAAVPELGSLGVSTRTVKTKFTWLVLVVGLPDGFGPDRTCHSRTACPGIESP